MKSFIMDLRYGLRMLLKKPGFTAMAVLTLALGIGANTAIFSVINEILIRPLPYENPDGIITVFQSNSKSGVSREDTSPANFLDWRDRSQSFDEMAAAEPFSLSLTGQGEPESFRTWLVSEGFFQILGVNALHGHTFLPEEYLPGNERVVIISHGLWQRRFGADPGLVGQKLLLNGQDYVVAGVLPPGVGFPSEREVWAPRLVKEADRRNRGSSYIKVIGRLRPGVSVEQAQHEMAGIASALAQEYPQANAEVGVTLVPLPQFTVEQIRPALFVLLGAVGLVLLIACANVASLFLARGAARQREFAIRAALGAARTRVLRQLLTESVLLALLGGLAGVLLAVWGVEAITAISPTNLLRVDQISIDGRVLGFAFGLSALTALVFGLAPSIQLSKPDLQEFLKQGSHTATAGLARHRLRNTLVISEIALALMLLIGAGLLVRSFVHLLQIDPGFSADNAVSLEVHVWSRNRTPQQRAAFFEQTLDKIAALPGVQAAGAVSALPFHDNSIDMETSFNIEGQPPPPAGEEPTAHITVATPDYFSALGIPLLRGRFFTQFDNLQGVPVALINDSMARRYWPAEDPVGKKITVGLLGKGTTREIIGIVGDTLHTGLDSQARTEVFVAHGQEPYGSMTYVVRTASDPLTLLQSIKEQVWSVNKDQPFASISTMRQLVSNSLGQRSFNLLLLGAFAVMALMLAAVGVYGLMSFSITQRTHEIGIRMAVGADRGDILKLIVGHGLALTLIGVCIGLVAAFALTRFMSSLLYGVSATDLTTFASVPLLLMGVAMLACYLPARRAMRLDPVVALRDV